MELGREENKERRKSWPMVSFTTWASSKRRKGFGLASSLRLERAGYVIRSGKVALSQVPTKVS